MAEHSSDPARPYLVQTAPIVSPPCRLTSAGSNASPIFARPFDQLETFFQPPALNERERQGLIRDGESWLAMVQDRNLTSHTYNRSTAEQVIEQVGAPAGKEGDG
jgi:hypothetical protein